MKTKPKTLAEAYETLVSEESSYKCIPRTKYIVLEDGNVARVLKKHKRSGRNYLFLRFNKTVTRCMSEETISKIIA